MSERLPFITLSIVALLTLAGCVGAAPASVGQPAGDVAADRTISVGASGAATAAPDLALVRVAVVSDADTAAAARDSTASAVDTLRSALREAGITDDAVRTTYFNLEPIYDFASDRRELVAYRASHGFEIEVDPARSGETIDIAVDNGATRVDGVEFTLAPATRDELRVEAIRAALSNARTDADTIAASTGVTIIGLHSASTSSVNTVPFEIRTEAVADRTVLEPGPVSVSATVQATYSIEG